MTFSLILFAVFEFPLAAAGVAGGVVSIPVIIHLLNRRRFKVVTWAAMRFLLAAQKKNSRRMRIEQLLLLALRCLIVMMLVLAMASATDWANKVWKWFTPSGARMLAGSARAHKIIVLDGSFSMGHKEGEQARFDRAKALAVKIVNDSPSGDGFSVVLMGAPPRRIVPEPSEDGRKVVTEIEAVKMPHGNADLSATLNTVESMLAASPSKFADRQVYFLTDLQQSTWIVKQPGAVAGTLRKIDEARGRTVFVDVGVEHAANLAVTGLTLGDELATTGRETAILATLHNFGSETREQVSVKLFIGRARATKDDTALEMRQVQESFVRAERGQQTPVAFGYKFPSPGEYVIQVQADGDALALDDVRSIVVTVKKDVPVLLVNGKPSGPAFDQATEWLRLALNPFEGPAVGTVAPRPTVINPLKFSDETQGDLTNYDCVFVCDVPALSGVEVKRLENHVRRGGGVVFCLGPQVQTGEYNRLLHKSGQGLLPVPLVGVQSATQAFHYQFAIDSDAEREPPLKAFRAATDRARLLEPRFNKFIMTGEPTAGMKPRKILGFTPILIPGRENAPGAKQPPLSGPAILEWNPPAPKDPKRPTNETPARLRGKVVLVTTTVNSDWNRWPPTPSFPALMQELVFYAASGRLREQEYGVGEALEVFLRTTATGSEARIRTPDGRDESARTQALDDASVLRWIDTDVSGLYRVSIGQDPHEHFFAVNVPSGGDPTLGNESNLHRTDRDELQKTYSEWEFQIVRELHQVSLKPVTPSTVETIPDHTLGSAIARILLLVVLFLCIVEVLLAWLFGHHTSAGPTENVPARQTTGLVYWLLPMPVCLLVSFMLVASFIMLHNAITGDFLGFLPEAVRRSVERGLNIPPPAAGEGSNWVLNRVTFLRDGFYDPWLAALFLTCVAILVSVIYLIEGSRSKLEGRLILVGLRMGLIALVLIGFLPQWELVFKRQTWPDVVLIIDDSQSMSTIDKFRDPRVKATADQLATLEELSEVDRLRLAQALVTRSNPDWLTALLTQRKVRLHVYHCSSRAHRLKDVNSAEEIGPALEAIRGLKATPENDSSQLGLAVRQVLNDFRGSSLAAVVMLTDGVTTEGEDLARVSKYAAHMGVPLYFVGIGDDLETRDVYLHDLQVEDSVYVNDRIVFELRLTGQGYNRLTAPVILREKGKKEELARQTVNIDGTDKPIKVRLIHQPKEAGEKIYEIETPLQPDESDKDNNRLERMVFVREAKLIKVLYVEGYRRYEYHYIKTLLERESERKGNKSIDLKVLLLEADPDYPAQDKSAIADFPTKAALNTFDVVILGDVDPRPRDNNKMAEHMRDLAEFVTERGGGLLMIAGERYSPHVYKDSPLRDVLPIDVTAERQPDEDAQRLEGYRPELTPVGRLHPIFRFSPDETENDKIWEKLRELFWYSEGYVPKRAAEVLAVHPKVNAEKMARKPGDLDEGSGIERHPLVLQQFVGAGRTMFFGFNETWRWGYREDQLRFNQFWIQTVRYLARSRLGRIDLRLDRQTPYRRGEPIKVTVRFPDDAPPPASDTEVKVVVERRQPGKGIETEVRTIQLTKLERSRATYETLMTKTPEGEYKFWLSSPNAPSPKPRAEGKVLAPPGEMERVRMAADEMKRAADETHGEFYTLANADSLIKDLPVGSRVTLNAPGGLPWVVWNSFVLFFMAILYLTTEWLIRKQMNLL